ncbi:hypothetical protein [Cryobacterium sp. CG_9.6]|uniref:hypothetical protein n=1 Tax=Cryobacterium sp. CG_9.6 TaxID=2760710 RepID=UPI002476C4BE|nr:hypothetical protein [Cryobacterium sp. CG_9.6]MDH6237961.1 hypothetical protein [Cryobacterium sp. CG_9.6]
MISPPAPDNTFVQALRRPDGLLLRSEAAALGLEQELRTAFDQKRIIRLRHGVYMNAREWADLDLDARYLCRIRAFAAVSAAPPVFSHYSAAAIWGLPRPSTWPADVHVQTPAAPGGRSRHGIVRHPSATPGTIVTHEGLQVTPVAHTAVAMARILSFPDAVAMMDKSIHVPRRGPALTTRDDLECALDALRGPRRLVGRTKAQRAAEFACTQSDSGGESVSRAHIFLLGFMAPELQVRFDDAHGLIGFVDFFWRRINRAGEFDGLGKYLKEEFTQGLSIAEIVMNEKRREDRIRACGPTFSRWDWPLARDLTAFGAFLHAEGVPRAR